MDPNASLAKIRRCAERLNADIPRHPTAEQLADLYRDALVMADMFAEMDAKIMSEGRLPIDWHRAQLDAIRKVPTAQG